MKIVCIAPLNEKNYHRVIEYLKNVTPFTGILFCIYLNAISIGIAQIKSTPFGPSTNIILNEKFQKKGIGTAVQILLCDYILLNWTREAPQIHMKLPEKASLVTLFLRNNLIRYIGKGNFLYNHTILKSYLLRNYVFHRYSIIFK